MSTGYLILYYKNSIIESYIRNFLMTKYISLNNAIGSNKLISKIKYYHRNYFCFINKEKNSVRCIIKLNKITNYQIDLKIKSQQELGLNELKKAEFFKSESAMLDNFFNLENNSDLNYLNNKINLIIKDSNNIYEFNCILLEDSIDMGVFEKIKKCMKEKEIVHNNQIQHKLRNNPFISNILSYEAAFRKKTSGDCDSMGIGGINQNDKNEKKDEIIFFDMKYNKYFLYDELLIDKNDNKQYKFFNKDKINDYINLNNKFKPIIKISNEIFSKPFSELDDIKDNIINSFDGNNINESKMKEESKPNNYLMDQESSNNQLKKEEEDNSYFNYQKNPLRNIANKKSNNFNNSSNSNNMPIIKEENQSFERFKRNTSYSSYTNNLYLKREISNNSFNSYHSENKNYYSNNSGYKYYNRGDYNNINNNSGEINKREKYENRNNYRDNNQMRNSYNSFKRKDSYGNESNDNQRNYSNNKDYSSYSSNNNSFSSGRERNYERSRDKSPINSPNNRYNNKSDSPRHYDKYNDRNNNINKNNNYYGDNNNINYYYNINNYYRPGNMNRWNEGGYYQKGGNFQRNKNDYYNSNNYYNNREGNYIRQRKRGNQSGGY